MAPQQATPAVGDVGCVVEIMQKAGLPDYYVVKSSGGDGITVWLGDFLAEELDLVETATV
jgi:hypothetical protein